MRYMYIHIMYLVDSVDISPRLTEEPNDRVVAPHCSNVECRVSIMIPNPQGAPGLNQALHYGLEPMPTGTQEGRVPNLWRQQRLLVTE